MQFPYELTNGQRAAKVTVLITEKEYQLLMVAAKNHRSKMFSRVTWRDMLQTAVAEGLECHREFLLEEDVDF